MQTQYGNNRIKSNRVMIIVLGILSLIAISGCEKGDSQEVAISQKDENDIRDNDGRLNTENNTRADIREIRKLSLDEIREIDDVIKKYTHRNVFSNVNNEQADIILGEMKLSDVEYYNFSTDLRDDRVYLVGLFASKKDTNEELINKLLDYIEEISPDVVSSLKNTVVYEINDFVVIVSDSGVDDAMLYADLVGVLSE